MTRYDDDALYETAKQTYGVCGPYTADADVQVDRTVAPNRTEQGAWVRVWVFVPYSDCPDE